MKQRATRLRTRSDSPQRRRFALVRSGRTPASATRSATSDGLTSNERGRITEAIGLARAPETRRAYASAWRAWQTWAEARGFADLPASPHHVAIYLTARAETGCGVATLGMICAAVRAAHVDRGLPDPTRHGVVASMLAGLKREFGRPARQAIGLTADALDRVIEAAPDDPSGRFDIALCRTMRDGMLRRSEAAALTWGDIEQAHDGSGRLLIRRSKTDQSGDGTVLYLSPATMAVLNTMRTPGARPSTPVFALRGTSPPHADSLAKRIRRAALRAGLGPGYSGHSPRVGMARDLTANGVEMPALMVVGRWRSPAMAVRYSEREEADRGAVASYYRSLSSAES